MSFDQFSWCTHSSQVSRLAKTVVEEKNGPVNFSFFALQRLSHQVCTQKNFETGADIGAIGGPHAFDADKRLACDVVLFVVVETRLQSRMGVLCPTIQNFA